MYFNDAVLNGHSADVYDVWLQFCFYADSVAMGYDADQGSCDSSRGSVAEGVLVLFISATPLLNLHNF